MNRRAQRLEFAPPPAPGLLPAMILAVLAHSLLMAALAWGVTWHHRAEVVQVQAELWATVPEPAALEPPPPPPPPTPAHVEEPPPGPSEAEIALEREKARVEQEKIRRDQEEVEAARLLKKQQKLEQERKAALAKKEAQRLATEQAAKEDARLREVQRQENLHRITGMANASGAANSIANRSAGPSAGYGARIRARVRPNIVFSQNVSGNPNADVEVHTAPDGTIASSKLIKSSGIKAFDDAVLRALEKTAVLPQDVDGRIPSPLIISFRPKD